MEKFSESRAGEKSEIISINSNKKTNRSLSRLSYKYFKVIIFNKYINILMIIIIKNTIKKFQNKKFLCLIYKIIFYHHY